jgi:hypothetical protein
MGEHPACPLIKGVASSKKFAVRTQAHELQDFSIGLAVYQQQIRLKVTLPMVAPFSRQRMVAVSLGKRLVLRQKRNG